MKIDTALQLTEILEWQLEQLIEEAKAVIEKHESEKENQLSEKVEE